MAKPDPDDMLQRLSHIYNTAAAKASPEARPKFQRVATTFDAWVAAANLGDREVAERRKAEFSLAMDQLRNYSRTDSVAYNQLVRMSDAVMEASKPVEPVEPAKPNVPAPKKSRRYRI